MPAFIAVGAERILKPVIAEKYCKVVTYSLRRQMQDFVYSAKFSLEEVMGRGAELRHVQEGGETLGVTLTRRKGRR